MRVLWGRPGPIRCRARPSRWFPERCLLPMVHVFDEPGAPHVGAVSARTWEVTPDQRLTDHERALIAFFTADGGVDLAEAHGLIATHRDIERLRRHNDWLLWVVLPLLLGFAFVVLIRS